MVRERPIVAVVTGTRAEFGLLLPVIRRLMRDSEINFRLLVTGAHLCADFGGTIEEIQAAEVPISRCIDILDGNAATPMDEALSTAVREFSAYFTAMPPDLLLVLGDRYEIFGAVTAAAINDIPVAHISGGEVTQGAKDEFFRHCITKMSCLHFPATEVYRRRVIQLGEQPDRVFNAGSLGAENVATLVPVRREDLSQEIGFDLSQPFLLCTYHPETLGNVSLLYALDNLLAAIDELGLRCLFTASNADDGGAEINARLADYCAENRRAQLVRSLGATRYLSAMRYCSAVAGNSSSAIIEAPTLRKPSVNIGDRQKGRLMAKSTLCCGREKADILAALREALSPEFAARAAALENPFGAGDASRIIVREIKTALLEGLSLKKSFYDIPFTL